MTGRCKTCSIEECGEDRSDFKGLVSEEDGNYGAARG